MKILALVSKDGRADAWWRIARPYEHLVNGGIDAKWYDLHDGLEWSQHVKNAIVVLQRIVLGNVDGTDVNFIQKLRNAGAAKIVYELDDDILSIEYERCIQACGRITPASFNKLFYERERTVKTIQRVDAVTCTTLPLKDVVQSVTNAPVYVLPNLIDVEWFESRLSRVPTYQNHSSSRQIFVGHAGGLKPGYDLEPMVQGWKRIEREFPQVMFVVGGYQHEIIYEIMNFDRIIRVPWAGWDEWPQLMQVDIGCCSITNTAFNRCKSPIKGFEYGLAGATIVASPTVYSQTIVHGIHGLLAADADQWYKAIKFMIENKDLRDDMVHENRKHIRNNFGLSIGWSQWKNAYEEILCG